MTPIKNHSQPRLSYRATVLALALAFASYGGPIMAEGKAGNAPAKDRRGPPAEALAACKALKAGDACSFTAQRGAVSGSCFAPQDKPLACRPKDAPTPSKK